MILINFQVTYPSIASFIYAHLLISAVILAVINRFQICSLFLLWVWVIFPFILLCIPIDVITFLPEMHTNGVFALHLLGCLLPLVVTLYHVNVLFSFFGPLLGRTGTEIPPDLVMAVFTSFCITVIFTYFVSFLYLFHYFVGDQINFRKPLGFCTRIFVLVSLFLLFFFYLKDEKWQ